MHLKAFITVVSLVMVLVGMNVHTAFADFVKDRDRAKLIVYFGTLVLFGALVINVTYRVIDKSMQAANVDYNMDK